MGFLGDFFGGVADFVSSACSLVVDSFAGVARGIADGIKGICESIGTEGMILIGSIALALIIPGFGIPELLTIIQIVSKVAEIFKIGGKDTPEEIGMKSEIADRKPDDFDSTEEYLRYLNKDVSLEPGATEKLSEIDRVKYGLVGAALDIKALKEKYQIELSPDFLKDVTIMGLDEEKVGAYVKDFHESGITKMQDMTDYLRGKEIETDKKTISSTMLDTMKELYPELSAEQLQGKLYEMEEQLKASNI